MSDGQGDRWPLSCGQRRLWWLQQLDPESYAYNTTTAIHFPNGIDRSALVAALAGLAARHEILRIHYVDDGSGTPAQVPTGDFAVPLAFVDIGDTDLIAAARAVANHPFDLAAAPPVR